MRSGPTDPAAHRCASGQAITEPHRAVVVRHNQCRGCGYDLHGLGLDNRCPECETPVAATMESVYAVYSPAFDRVARGLIALPRLLLPPVLVHTIVGPCLFVYFWFSDMSPLLVPLVPRAARRRGSLESF